MVLNKFDCAWKKDGSSQNFLEVCEVCITENCLKNAQIVLFDVERRSLKHWKMIGIKTKMDPELLKIYCIVVPPRNTKPSAQNTSNSIVSTLNLSKRKEDDTC